MEHSKELDLSTDKPIQSRKDDLLGRADFAESLADAIRGQKSDDNLVIALYGPWGCGKTSVTNMTLEALQEKGKESEEGKHTVVKFNPWELADKSQIIAELFSEISNQVDPDTSPRLSNLKRLFMKYGARLTLSAIGPAMSIAANAGFIDPTVAVSVSGGIAAVSGIIKDMHGERQSSRGPSLSTLKSHLAHELGKFDGKILVVIDDLDRLDPEEVSLMFKVIKANLDLPNMVFLLAFQRDIVEKALTRGVSNDAGHFSGKGYLEKIIQVGFDVPATRSDQIERYLFSRLDIVIGNDLLESRFFDQYRWWRVWSGGMAGYIRNLRDVHRYLGSVDFHVRFFRFEKGIEVNVVDLLALEALRVFDNQVYRRLSSSKAILTSGRSTYPDFKQAEVAAIIESLLDNANNRDSAECLVKELFPNCEWAFSSFHFGPAYQSGWLPDRRIADRMNFDRFFTLSPPDYDVTEAELVTLMSIVVNRDQFMKEVLRLENEGRLMAFLSRIKSDPAVMPSNNVLPAIVGFLDLGDQLGGGKATKNTTLDMDLTFRLRSVVCELIERSDVSARSGLMLSAMNQSTGLYLPLLLVNDAQLRIDEPGTHGCRLVNEAELIELQIAAISKILRARDEGRLATVAYLGYVLGRWAEWGDHNSLKEFIHDLLSSSDGVLNLLVGFLRSTLVSTGSQERINYYMNLEEIEEFVSLDSIDKSIAHTSVENPSSLRHVAVNTYEEAKAKRAAGGSVYERWKKWGDE